MLLIFYHLVSLIHFFGMHKGDWGIFFFFFLNNLSKMLFKKGQKSLLPCLKLFEYQLKKFNSFKPSFHKFFYSGLFWFKLCSFLLARDLIWRHFSLGSIWNYIYIYIYQKYKMLSIEIDWDQQIWKFKMHFHRLQTPDPKTTPHGKLIYTFLHF